MPFVYTQMHAAALQVAAYAARCPLELLFASVRRGLTYPPQIPVTEQSEKKGDYEQREEKELAPGKNERQQEQQ
jgi:hypothetical protein